MIVAASRRGWSTSPCAFLLLAFVIGYLAPRTVLSLSCERAWALAAGRYLEFDLATARAHPTAVPPQCLLENIGTAYCLELAAPRPSFDAWLADCAWEDGSAMVDLKMLAENYSELTVPPMPDFPRDKYRADGTVRTCGGVVDGREWRAVAIGPYYTTGGFSWGFTITKFNSSVAGVDDHMELVNGRPRHALVAYVVGNIDDRGRLQGNPPVHQHHFHLFGSRDGDVRADLMNNHGDSQCADSEGGTNCMLRFAPPGFAYIADGDLMVGTEYNDVRAAGSPPLKSWVFAAWSTVRPSSVRGAVQQTQLPISFFPLAERGAAELWTEVESVSWSTGRLDQLSPCRGIVPGEHREWCIDVFETRKLVEWYAPVPPGATTVEAYFHSHISMLDDIWFFQGPPHTVFHDAPAMRALLSEDNILYRVGAIDEFKASIARRQLLPGATRLACAYSLASKTEWAEVGGVWKKFARRPRCALDATKPEYTGIAFFRRNTADSFSAREGQTKLTSRMHATLRLYWVPGVGEPGASEATEANAEDAGAPGLAGPEGEAQAQAEPDARDAASSLFPQTQQSQQSQQKAPQGAFEAIVRPAPERSSDDF